MGALDALGAGGYSGPDTRVATQRAINSNQPAWGSVNDAYGAAAQQPMDEEQLAAVRALMARARGQDSAAQMGGAYQAGLAAGIAAPNPGGIGERQAVLARGQAGTQAIAGGGQAIAQESQAAQRAALQAQVARQSAVTQGQEIAQQAELAKRQQSAAIMAAQQKAQAEAKARRNQLLGSAIKTGATIGMMAALASDKRSKRQHRIPKGWVK